MWKWDRRLLTLACILNFSLISNLEANPTYDDDDESPTESNSTTPPPKQVLKLKSNPFAFKKSSKIPPKSTAIKKAKKENAQKAQQAQQLLSYFTEDDDEDLSDFVVPDDVVEYADDDANNGSGSDESSSTTQLLDNDDDFSDEAIAPVKKSSEKPKTKLVPKKNPAKVAPVKKQTPVASKKRKSSQEDDDAVITTSSATISKAAANDNAPDKDAPKTKLLVKELVEGGTVPKAFRGKTIAFLDSETTSFSAEIGGRLVSFAAILIKDGKETKRKEWIFNPGKDSNKGAFLAHKISRSVTEKMPPFEDLSDEISAFLGEADFFVAHNAKFDYRYIRAEHERATILRQLQKWNLSALMDPEAPLEPESRKFLGQQLKWLSADPHIKAKRLAMLKSRMTTAIWLYTAHQSVLEKGEILNPETGRFAFPFLPTPKSQGLKNVPGFAKKVNRALLKIFRKLEVLDPRTQQEKDRIGWKKFESVDVSNREEFDELEVSRKALFDRQIRGASTMKKFDFAALPWSDVYNWERVGQKKSVFYKKPDQLILGEIMGYLNLAKDLVDNGVFKADSNPPEFFDFDERWIDTLALAKGTKGTKGVLEKGKDVPGFKLNDLCQYYGVSLEPRKNGHGALIDSDLLARVFAHLKGTEFVEVAANDNVKQSVSKKAKTDMKMKAVKFFKDKDAMAEDDNGCDGDDGDDELIGGLF